jgi:hypothetical protein
VNFDIHRQTGLPGAHDPPHCVYRPVWIISLQDDFVVDMKDRGVTFCVKLAQSLA